MRRPHAAAVALLIGTLALGGALGAAGLRWATGTGNCERRDRANGRSYVERLDRELGLTPEQRTRVEAILERQREAMAALWRDVKPRAEEIRRTTRQEIEALLTPEQRTRYLEWLERDRARREHRNGNKRKD